MFETIVRQLSCSGWEVRNADWLPFKYFVGVGDEGNLTTIELQECAKWYSTAFFTNEIEWKLAKTEL